MCVSFQFFYVPLKSGCDFRTFENVDFEDLDFAATLFEATLSESFSEVAKYSSSSFGSPEKGTLLSHL